jgi:hypothetical protein
VVFYGNMFVLYPVLQKSAMHVDLPKYTIVSLPPHNKSNISLSLLLNPEGNAHFKISYDHFLFFFFLVGEFAFDSQIFLKK